MNRNNSYATPMHSLILAGVGLLAAGPALAHHPMGGATPSTMTEGLLSGLGHPIIGIDHLAFLAVVALLAFKLSGAARWLAPAAFVGGTLGGALLHLRAVDLPMAELLVALTVVVGGITVLYSLRAKPAFNGAGLSLLLAIAGVFHGYAYGESIIGAEATPLLSYLIGFSLVQYGLIAGMLTGLSMLAVRSQGSAARLVRTGGLGAVAVGGLFMAVSLV
jgi:urease accessory protein